MTRSSIPFLSAAAVAAICLSVSSASAQTNVPTAPVPAPNAAAGQAPPTPTEAAPLPTSVPPAPATTPSAPAPSLTAPAFPKPAPANFTATSPTTAEVNAFLEANWGYDSNRVWQVQAILKTPVEGVSRVIVLVAEKASQQKPFALVFYTLPDGKHLITGNALVAFGTNPFAAARAELQQKADGPFRGSASKDLEVVEFTDFQDTNWKVAQANVDKLAQDFPQAHIVFQNEPIASIHPEALKAAEYGACVAKLGGNSAFFKFASAVYEAQAGLGTPDGATMTLNSAAAAAGMLPKKIATCAASPQTQATVADSMKLGLSLGISAESTFMINGRAVPTNAPYDVLKRIVEFQAKLDGVSLIQPAPTK